MAIKLANNAVSVLASSISSSATSLAVLTADAVGFPTLSAGDWFPLTLVDAVGNLEVVKVTARSSANMTITRGQEGTTARAFDAGARVELRLTKSVIDEILTLINTLPTNAQVLDAISSALATALSDLTNGAPAALDQLNEFAAALGNDPAFSATILDALANRLRVDAASSLSTAQQAQGRSNLGLGSIATANVTYSTSAPDDDDGKDGDLHFMHA